MWTRMLMSEDKVWSEVTIYDERKEVHEIDKYGVQESHVVLTWSSSTPSLLKNKTDERFTAAGLWFTN